MRTFYKLIGIISIFAAVSTNASMYFCSNKNTDILVINYNQYTHVPTSTYSFAKEAEEAQAPLDGSHRFTVKHEGDMLSSIIQTDNSAIEIRFEDADEWEKMRCRSSSDKFGMPILAPHCEKKALMISNDMEIRSTMLFTCSYLAD